MHSIFARCSSLCTLTITTVTVMMFMCFLSTTFLSPTASVDLQVDRVAIDKAIDYTQNENIYNDLGLVTINLASSLDHLFNWNVKQLFLYLTAEYKTANNKLNQVVLWDKIIQRGSKADLMYRGMSTKYYFWDDGRGLLGNPNVTLTLSWNSIPNVGLLSFQMAKGSHSFSLPNVYSSRKSNK